ncbi:MAG TPA: type II toxin-antitoxin system HicA family toxin [Anaerolineae bacterium]|nr:type II toxin-antitoxin system HicA family toxin [Anaerolineae bacterium]
MRSRLPSLSSQRLIAALRRAGFEHAPRRGKGSHHALMRRDADGRIRLVIVPERRDLPRGTVHGVLQQAGLTAEELADLL